MERDRSGTEMPAGQGHRQFHQPEGGRRRFSRTGAQDPALRSRRGGDGLRRKRAGRLRRTQSGHRHARLPHSHRSRWECRPPTSSSIRPFSPWRTGIEEHNQYAVAFIEATRQIKATLPGSEDQRRRQQYFVFVPRQQRRPRGHALGISLSRHSRRPGHGHRQRRATGDLRRDRARTCGNAWKTCS